MFRKFLFLVGFGLNLACVEAQNFPKLGNDTLLDVACWNIEWFGDVSNGPTDEGTQYTNVLALLNKTDMDVFALEEMSNYNTYNTLSNALASKYDTYISAFSQTQKMCLYWKKSMFNVIGIETKDIPLNSSENYNFASRPPLQVCLQTIGGTKTDTIYFLVMHMKAYADIDSYNRRVGASAALKTYIEANLKGKKFIVLGDWNDDLDQSTYNAAVTPYKNLLDANYTFPSKELTDIGKSSYAFSVNMIDHILNSKTLDSIYLKGTAHVFDNAPSYCTGFSNNTSDHYPVYAFYDWKKLTTRVIPAGLGIAKSNSVINIFPNPVSSVVSINCDRDINSLRIVTIQGKIISNLSKENLAMKDAKLDLAELESGIYFIELTFGNSVYLKKIVKN
jgi:endonuclease/exonuclease/phosphatase family metal-dependent hydrolase